jgi:tRNA G26 N,N-dimethylase Trm1
MWIAPIHDGEFVNSLLKNLDDDEVEAREDGQTRFGTHDRMKGMLSVVSK